MSRSSGRRFPANVVSHMEALALDISMDKIEKAITVQK